MALAQAMRSTLRTLALLAVAALATGCASTRLEATVQTVSAWPAGRTPGSFAFERRPAKETPAKEQDSLEAEAGPSLVRAGFTPASIDSADMLVQVTSRKLQGQVVDPFDGALLNGSSVFGGRSRGAGWGYGAGWGSGANWGATFYGFEVSLVILDARSRQALYESSAGINMATPDERIWSALIAAAMKDFPLAAASPRRVSLELAP